MFGMDVSLCTIKTKHNETSKKTSNSKLVGFGPIAHDVHPQHTPMLTFVTIKKHRNFVIVVHTTWCWKNGGDPKRSSVLEVFPTMVYEYEL